MGILDASPTFQILPTPTITPTPPLKYMIRGQLVQLASPCPALPQLRNLISIFPALKAWPFLISERLAAPQLLLLLLLHLILTLSDGSGVASVLALTKTQDSDRREMSAFTMRLGAK
ncbi:hypothetical protein BHE74_00006316 [Ensete ventricosum]|nr:hypothetical protein BHE74_00006316 [Ensete ventricosum]